MKSHASGSMPPSQPDSEPQKQTSSAERGIASVALVAMHMRSDAAGARTVFFSAEHADDGDDV